MVVESMIRRCFILSGSLPLRLSDERRSRYMAYKSRYIASKTESGRRLLASDSVLRDGIMAMLKWLSLRASPCMEAVISRKESKRMITA